MDRLPFPLVLASTSPYRRELLTRLQLPFAVISPEVDETPREGERPQDTARRLSVAKATAVAKTYPAALIIGSDQVAVLDGVQLGKPHTHENAFRQLQTMRGRRVVFHTALTLLNSHSGNCQTQVVPFDVTFRHYDDGLIQRYLDKEQPYNCAGSAKSEGLGIVLIEKMSGDDPNTLIGLPLIALVDMLHNEGASIV
ncbi:MAG TPA: septum formation inhibitor Maf [Betaproteobacteria bacterium]|nr:septum formation inhibitor Maf [Betaproteobacteria bacterium]